MILSLEMKYKGKKKSLGLLFCFTTSKQQGITQNSLSYWEYLFSGTVNSCNVAAQFKYPTFSFHLTRTLHMVCLRRLLNLNLTYFKVSAYLITFTHNTTQRRTYLDKNWFYHCSHSEIAQHIFVITLRSILGKQTDWPDALIEFLIPGDWAQWRKGEESHLCQLPRSPFMPAWHYRVARGVGRPAFQACNRLIYI